MAANLHHGCSSANPSTRELSLLTLPPIDRPGVFYYEPIPLDRNQASVHSPSKLEPMIVTAFNRKHVFHSITSDIRPSPGHCSCRDCVRICHQDNRFTHSFNTTTNFRLEIKDPLSLTNTQSQYQVQDLSLRSSIVSTPPLRPLTTALDVVQLAMTTTISAPGSPPDLSGSRSSKSSSLCSSSDNTDKIATDITHFEDIGLDDDRLAIHNDFKNNTLGAPYQSVQHRNININHGAEEKRQSLPGLRNHIRDGALKQEFNPRTTRRNFLPPIRRVFTSPAAEFSQANIENTRPRSVSPRSKAPISVSPQAAPLSATSLRPGWTPVRPSPGIRSRRESWQSQRKTVKELEAEYHDSDDELPEDASLWNVPVSPYPGNRSARSSFHGSPDREPFSQTPAPFPLAHASTIPEIQPRNDLFSRPLQKTRPIPPRSASLNTSWSGPSSPRNSQSLRSHRAKSWTLAMADLSEEAKIITETLEYHAELAARATENDCEHEISNKKSPSSASSRRASAIQLPPLQKGNLDFMPISKEKEAILSRTRPSWLPPKNPKEEAKHLKEYQRMMAASLEAEKKKEEKLKAEQAEKANTREALDRIWQFYVAETTDISVIDTRVHDLCWRGISTRLRGKVWQRIVGNPLGLTSANFDTCLSRAKAVQSQTSKILNAREKVMLRWFGDIERDAETAFPELKLFQRGGPLWQDLVDVCEAYSCYRSDIGYTYGTQLIAALLLLQLSTPSEAFILLANCLNRKTPLAFQLCDSRITQRTYNHAVSTLAIKFPRLHEYLFGSIEQGGLGFAAEEIFEPMLRTIFCNGLDVDRLCRVWDIWLFEGDKSLVQSAVALVGALQSQISNINGDVDLKRRNIQEMLGWGPFNRSLQSGHWNLSKCDEEKFVEEIRQAGTLDYQGK